MSIKHQSLFILAWMEFWSLAESRRVLAYHWHTGTRLWRRKTTRRTHRFSVWLRWLSTVSCSPRIQYFERPYLKPGIWSALNIPVYRNAFCSTQWFSRRLASMETRKSSQRRLANASFRCFRINEKECIFETETVIKEIDKRLIWMSHDQRERLYFWVGD